MTKILAIGNSFSEDATVYLHDLAQQGGYETKVVNLFIGGCPLRVHWDNALHDTAAYVYILNGQPTGNPVSIKEVLLSDTWDFVTIQQASYDSGILESYLPYAPQLLDYIKEISPKSTRLIHQTWAYDEDSTLDAFAQYGCSQAQMYAALKDAYQKVADLSGLDLIPCGDVIQALRGLDAFNHAKNGVSVCRDGFHMHLIYGRYATAATWFECLLKGNILLNDYTPPNSTEADAERLALIKQTVHRVCTG